MSEELARHLSESGTFDATDQVLHAAVDWQREEMAYHVAQSTWYAAKCAGDDSEQTLYQEFRLAESARDGALARLALATRRYMKTAEVD